MLTRILILAVVFQISLGVGAGFTAEKAKKDVQTQAPIPAKSAEAKPSAIPVNSPPPQPLAPTYLTTPFDMSLQKVPPAFRGHDIEEVYQAFEKRAKSEKKDEFETTEQYRQRLKDQTGQPLYGTIEQNSALPLSQHDCRSWHSTTLTVKSCL